MSELRKRVPETCVDWLRHVEQWNLWAELIRCNVTRNTDEDTNVLILKATYSWLDSGGPVDDQAATLKP